MNRRQLDARIDTVLYVGLALVIAAIVAQGGVQAQSVVLTCVVAGAAWTSCVVAARAADVRRWIKQRKG
jgi:hypothetical protein